MKYSKAIVLSGDISSLIDITIYRMLDAFFIPFYAIDMKIITPVVVCSIEERCSDGFHTFRWICIEIWSMNSTRDDGLIVRVIVF